MKKRKVKRKLSSVQTITLGFFGVIILGTFLLSLPIASVSGETHFLDALFTATSSVCVTGLVTLNTAAHWTVFGKLVILALIEIGGLSFMMLTMIFFLIVGKKIDLSTRLIFKDVFNQDTHRGVVDLGKYVLKFSIFVQALGALLLFGAFYPKYGIKKGLFYGVFHSISAFCNAGFDLFGNSLEGWQTNSYVLIIISFLIIAGGLGFVIWRDILHWKRNNKKLSIHTSLTLRVTLILLIGSFLSFLFIERNLSFLSEELTFGQRLANTFFLSVTPRTAGFNSIPYADLTDASIIITMFLMFVGGSPGSTAGGVKTTTLGVLVLHAWATIHGRERTVYRERTISKNIVVRAFVLFFISFLIVSMAIIVLSITETIPPNFGIEYIAFEVFSAFGTVGVTMGLTPELTFLGKMIIIFLMFIGRVGVYTFLLAIAKRQRANETLIRYPEERVMIG